MLFVLSGVQPGWNRRTCALNLAAAAVIIASQPISPPSSQATQYDLVLRRLLARA